MTQSITITKPDDWHLHLRDGAMLKAVLPWTASHFKRAIIMPNLVPPVVTTKDALAYRQRILATDHGDFDPLMTLYLTEQSEPDDVALGAAEGVIHAVKLYPAGATTNSASGVTNIDAVMPVLEKMAQIGLPLCVHGEVTTPSVDIFDREKVFIDTILDPLRQRLPELRVTMEHITTKDAAAYVADSAQNLAASITTHHLILNRNHMLVGAVRPHYYCLPILKREEHRQALVDAAISGDPRYFLGTDSAPHPTGAKESACGCAGVFSAPNTLSCLAHVFEAHQALDKLEGFVSRFGAAWYKLPVNDETLTLYKRDEPVALPATISAADETVTLFDPGFPLYWHVMD